MLGHSGMNQYLLLTPVRRSCVASVYGHDFVPSGISSFGGTDAVVDAAPSLMSTPVVLSICCRRFPYCCVVNVNRTRHFGH